jgi:uncharacterized phage protein (TIGR02218 family)
MKTLAPGLQAHLDSGTTTLCHCWRMTLRSGERLGFTDHDVAVLFDDTTFEAQAGFTGSEIESAIGLAVDNLEASGALASAKISEDRLHAGDCDHAKVELWRVNWQDTAQRVMLRAGHLGEVTAGGGAFTAELRGLAHLFNQTQGRIYQYGCDAELGDARCGVNLELPSYKGAGTITAVENASLVVSGVNAFSSGWFTRGTITWTAGVNAGRVVSVRTHRLQGTLARINLWATLPFTAAIGDAVTLRAGCDKQLATCKSKFANTANHRGFPHMPGNDFILTFPTADDPRNNGGRRTN